MEEEKKRKRKVVDTNEIPTDDFSVKSEPISAGEIEVKSEPVIVSKKEKKTFEVVLVTPSNVIFKVGENSNSFTPNIWGKNLKPGDKITL